jgi:hypothetical protein
MRTFAILAGIIVSGLLLPAAAQDRKTDPRKKAPAEPRTWMCRKGELLWHEKFEGTALSKEWRKGLGSWIVDNGTLKGLERPEENHQAYTYRKVSGPNVVMQFTFKFDGAKTLGSFFKGDSHVASLVIGAGVFTLRKMTGIGSTTKGADLDSAKMKLDDGAWHTAVWEFFGDEMVATIDDQQTVLARVEGLSLERDRYELFSRGGAAALYKDVKAWKAEPDPQWPQTRARIFELTRKNPAALGYK